MAPIDTGRDLPYDHDQVLHRISQKAQKRGEIKRSSALMSSLRHLTDYAEDFSFSRCSNYKIQYISIPLKMVFIALSITI